MATLKLIMLRGPREGETLEFLPGSSIKIGRNVRGNTISIKDDGISSKHLSIQFDLDKWVLRDLDSSNGTLLNGIQLSPNTPFNLSDGDSIKIGEITSISVKIECTEDIQLRRNPRRGGDNKAARSVAEMGRRGKVNVEKEEPEELSVVEVTGNRKRVHRRNARVVEGSESADVIESKPKRQVSSRRTRSANSEDSVVVSRSELGIISENSVMDGGEVKIEAKRTRGRRGRRRKNLLQDPMETNTQECLIVEEQINSRKFTTDDAVKSQDAKGVDLMEKEPEQAGNEGKDGNVNDSNVKETSGALKNGCGSGIKENYFEMDLEKMTLGDLFDYWETNLPKQIIEETDKIIEGMREKAAMVSEYMIQQKNEVGKVDGA